jgi:hypothetical protein
MERQQVGHGGGERDYDDPGQASEPGLPRPLGAGTGGMALTWHTERLPTSRPRCDEMSGKTTGILPSAQLSADLRDPLA